MILPYDTFVFTHRTLEGRTVRFGYRLQGGGEAVSFEETFELPFDNPKGSPADVAAALQGMHLVLGTSYWKTCCPPHIEIEGPGLSAADAAFWTEVYNSGLGEFYYRNGLDPAGLARFHGEGDDPAVAGEPAEGPAIVLAGGGAAARARGGGKGLRGGLWGRGGVGPRGPADDHDPRRARLAAGSGPR